MCEGCAGVEFLLSIKSELTTVCNYKLCTGKNFIKYWSPHPSGTGPNALRNRVPGPGLKRPEVNKETGQRFTDDPPCQVRAPRRPWDFKFRVIVDRAQSHLMLASHGQLLGLSLRMPRWPVSLSCQVAELK